LSSIRAAWRAAAYYKEGAPEKDLLSGASSAGLHQLVHGSDFAVALS
jgi:hypothetical protein